MNINTKKYIAKLLLFGEYTIIKGGEALAFPLQNYFGKWCFSDKNQDNISNKNLFDWADYIDDVVNKNDNSPQIDTKRFRKDLQNGLYFDSNIPIGYGIGSSGALCAALYDEYGIKKIENKGENDTIFMLKIIFQSLENFFHGSSSGVDPLICYLNQPLLLKGKDNAEQIVFKKNPKSQSAVFLLNTHQPRQTEPLVNFFLEQLKDDIFAEKFENEWCLYSEKVIQAFLNQEYVTFFNNLRRLSQFQLQHLPPMIPKGFESIWTESLHSNLFTLKLCGAGGGGFILGFTQNWQETQQTLSNQNIIKVMDF